MEAYEHSKCFITYSSWCTADSVSAFLFNEAMVADCKLIAECWIKFVSVKINKLLMHKCIKWCYYLVLRICVLFGLSR